MTPPTPRQQTVLDTIVAFTKANRCPPTIRDLMPLLGIRSPNGIVCHLDALEAKGLIERGARGAARGIAVVDFCPCCGRETT